MIKNMFRLPAGILAWILMSCGDPGPVKPISVIPKPSSAVMGTGIFTLTDKTTIQTDGKDPETQRIATYLSDFLKPATGYPFVVSVQNSDTVGLIRLSLSASDSSLGEEGYRLKISTSQVLLTAYKPAGLFRGVQTIRQLLPANIESGSVQQTAWQLPVLEMRDFPEYGFRGAMLDVARHFFGVADVKRFINQLAKYKMNILHLHLSDDQGWRIEIKAWPKLTTVGGLTQVGGGKGGFYTQEQYADIVQYAADRFITIIPEIDMPGHTNAALVSYPELHCRDTALKSYTGTEVGFSSLCTSGEKTYKFVEDVIRELSAITPGPYIHIGGDESHVTPKKDYITFMNRVQPLVSKYGKKVIGWDEIAHANLEPNTVVQFWADVPNSQMAVKKGGKVIMSPSKKIYLDMQYDKNTKLGLHWAAYVEVDDAYKWDPATLVPGIKRENILGVEAPLWTETIVTMDDIEYMVFPRLPGVAEIGWTASKDRNWEEYRQRLAQHGSRFKAMGIDYYPSKKVDWK